MRVISIADAIPGYHAREAVAGAFFQVFNDIKCLRDRLDKELNLLKLRREGGVAGGDENKPVTREYRDNENKMPNLLDGNAPTSDHGCVNVN